MYDKFLSRTCIGTAQVETTLSDNRVKLGDKLKGAIEIKGGREKERIASIFLTIWTFIESHDERKKLTLKSEKLIEPIEINPGEEKTVPFEIMIDYGFPISTRLNTVYLSTELDTKEVNDPKDMDVLTLIPDDFTNQMFQAMKELGFKQSYQTGRILERLKDENFKHFEEKKNYVQEFDYLDNDQFDDAKLYFDVNANKINMVIKLDTKPHNFKTFIKEKKRKDKQVFSLTINRGGIFDKKLLESKIKKMLS